MMKAISIVKNITPGGLFEQLVYPPAFLERQRQTRFKQEWRISQFMYEQMMREWNSPRYQRGSVGMSVIANAAQQFTSGGSPSGPVGNVVLTAHTMTSTDLGAQINSRVAFFPDGRLMWRDDPGATGSPEFILPLGSPKGEWWSETPPPVFGSPPGASDFGSGYSVRYLSAGLSGTYNVSAAVADQWIDIREKRIWGNNRTIKSAPGTTTTSATFELDSSGSPPGNSAEDSAVITLVSIN